MIPNDSLVWFVYQTLFYYQGRSGRREVGGYGKFKNRPAYTGFGTPHRRIHLNTTVLFCIGAERIKESKAGPTTVDLKSQRRSDSQSERPWWSFTNEKDEQMFGC